MTENVAANDGVQPADKGITPGDMESFAHIFGELSPFAVSLATLVGIVAGVVKGMVGFAMPTILIAGLSTIMAPDVALATLILPTLLANGFQSLRHGWKEAWDAIRRYRVFLIVSGAALIVAAQFARSIPEAVFYLLIGGLVFGFALLQLLGRSPTIPPGARGAETGVALLAGVMGGVSGMWGPPTVAYLTATNTPKADQIRVQGVIYGLGSVALVIAHLQSGVLRDETIPFSLYMVIPATLGLLVGTAIQDRIDQAVFRKVTLYVLLIFGLNLIRRGLF